MAILVMLNNYLHDLATAVFAVSAAAAYLLQRSLAMRREPAALRPVVTGLVKIGVVSLVWTLLAGLIRGMTYREFEWVEAAGRGQVPVLVVKHVILVCLVTTGAVVLVKAHRLARTLESE
jgi:ABC-type transporter Mla maintaining outer membrane lipid asymmetry permease subunit MlaE